LLKVFKNQWLQSDHKKTMRKGIRPAPPTEAPKTTGLVSTDLREKDRDGSRETSTPRRQ